MDYAIQLLIPIVLGLMAASWLVNDLGWAPYWWPVAAVLGFVASLMMMYKRLTLAGKNAARHASKTSENADNAPELGSTLPQPHEQPHDHRNDA